MTEPAADLAVILSIASVFKNRPLPDDLVAVGEVGLTGEIRTCGFLENRISEAEKMGFARIAVPRISSKAVQKFKNIKICQYSSILQILKDLF